MLRKLSAERGALEGGEGRKEVRVKELHHFASSLFFMQCLANNKRFCLEAHWQQHENFVSDQLASAVIIWFNEMCFKTLSNLR